MKFELFLWLYQKFPSQRKRLVRIFDRFTQRKLKVRNVFNDIKNLIGENVHIVDGGANVGLYSIFFRIHFPNAKIYAIEPVPNSQLTLTSEQFNFDIYNVALGSKTDRVTINVCKDSQRSSLLTPLDVNVIDKIEAYVTTLDNWVKDNKIEKVDFIKLDLEGYDLQALLGAKELLKKQVKGIFVEISFVDRFKEYTDDFFDIANFLSKYNFKLFNFYGLGSTKKGKLHTGNALFVKEDLLEFRKN